MRALSPSYRSRSPTAMSNHTFERTNTGVAVLGFTEHRAPVFAAQRKR